MLITTTHTVEGRHVQQYLGLVVGEAIVGANIFKDFFASVRDIVGGRSGAYEQELQRARDLATGEMTEKARAMGANAILGVDLDYEVLGRDGSMLMVNICGTAVVLD